MKVKKKLRDLTKEEYAKWLLNCFYCNKKGKCSDCCLGSVERDPAKPSCWYFHKDEDIYSDKFLDQEIEIEVDILTTVEKGYLNNVIEPFRDKVESITKYKYTDIESSIKGDINIVIKNSIGLVTLSFTKSIFEDRELFEGMEQNKQYTLEELGL